MLVKSIAGRAPSLHPQVRAAENAVLAGDITLAEGVSVWYGAVLRGDESSIRVGRGTNLQDNCVLHVDPGHPIEIGENVTVGHGAVIHGCTIEDGCVIGMGAILLNGCRIGAGSLVAAGALVTQNTVIPPGSLAMGSPAKGKRPLTQEEQAENLASAQEYRRLSRQLPPAGGGI
ncbi:gamma carbonic anhydrase family protein [Pseudoflavonifractor sp. 524-17]|uniref:gamma carbonic anhydrase family protein n=1 Tax=Pseudoflavonifractor sp. 524-17 TaxID=2304577 RepID=UPI00137A2577|nr:gamma carbonic anhydrase family protein [Pseudoflavonifractor sp. 524-17]NCE65973.1 gamma carbonic anhydrase family protein [Pseudoflavonifractor sp. 524-17]